MTFPETLSRYAVTHTMIFARRCPAKTWPSGHKHAAFLASPSAHAAPHIFPILRQGRLLPRPWIGIVRILIDSKSRNGAAVRAITVCSSEASSACALHAWDRSGGRLLARWTWWYATVTFRGRHNGFRSGVMFPSANLLTPGGRGLTGPIFAYPCGLPRLSRVPIRTIYRPLLNAKRRIDQRTDP